MLRSACLAALCVTASGFAGMPVTLSAAVRAQLPASGRAGSCSLAMVATGKPAGAKINVKKGDFDILNPTKRVGEVVKEKKVIKPPKIESEIDADYDRSSRRYRMKSGNLRISSRATCSSGWAVSRRGKGILSTTPRSKICR